MTLQTNSSVPIYDSANLKNPAIEELQKIFLYRDLIFQLVRRDITTRYKRSVLGIAWTMLHPLAMMVILSFVFSQVFQAVQGYSAYLLGGLVLWNFFAQGTTLAITSVVGSADLFRRIYLPPSVFVVAAIGTGFVNMLLSLVPLFVVMLFSGVAIRFTALLTLFTILPIVFFALGVGLLVATLGVYFPDVAEIYKVLLTAWFYATPILYPVDQIPEKAHFILALNPLYPLVELFRVPLYGGDLPSLSLWLSSLGVSLLTFIAGWVIFTNKSREFLYYV